ncbi:choline transporter-like protein 1 [Phlebotomus argentipes]|uniref:choline transporter-like protein 1 n=1 Tax=Phlebotomus argentipes TaxID=94469 RepID=UPI00289349A4|nr:choline transporter-like protein 1 [Phlebotomus argentipes]
MGISLSCCENLRKVEPASDKENSEEDLEDETKSSSVINYNRTCTDVFYLILFIAFIVVLVSICGRENIADSTIGCKGANMTSLKYLFVEPALDSETTVINRMCVSSCEDYNMKSLLNRCIPKQATKYSNKFFSKSGIRNFFEEVSEDLDICWREILCLFVLAFVLSFVIVFLLQYLVGILVWLVLIGIVLASIIGVIWLWVKYDLVRRSTPEDSEVGVQRRQSWLAYAIIGTIITICICLVIFVMRKRVQLVIQLFKEAGKAITSVPLLLLEPFLTFFALSVTVTLWFYFALWIESSGHVTVQTNQSVSIVKDSTMRVTRWYNLLAFFWFTQFVMGCQHCVIAGTVAAWFFARDKSALSCPMAGSFKRLLRYHLGTVACGSLIVSLVQIVRVILKSVEYWLRDPQNKALVFISTCCHCCLGCFENLLQYLTRNAYIETAIFGHPFCEAGRKAFALLSNNALRVFVINSVGDFVLFLSKAFVVLCTVLVGTQVIQQKDGVQHNWVLLVLVGLFAYLVSHCFVAVYEMTIDTIFICFCEDCERNDGIAQPYFMSRGLMEFVQNSKKALEAEEKTNAWSSRE